MSTMVEAGAIPVAGTDSALVVQRPGRRCDKPETEVQLLPSARRKRHCRPAAGRLPGTQETRVRFPPMARETHGGEVEDRAGLITQVRQARLLPPLQMPGYSNLEERLVSESRTCGFKSRPRYQTCRNAVVAQSGRGSSPRRCSVRVRISPTVLRPLRDRPCRPTGRVSRFKPGTMGVQLSPWAHTSSRGPL